ncbi:putative transposase [Ereboglobus sp. PH5-10]|uniref:REP-associated tyrosine transposase n=1 Tax=Ereboglobus sp. PH5-10 TaxID=2940629 RepID=UPI0024059603|nr:transposase [Ereboglobus sp. PH5-10]MDF9826965.1 putative transposase [Ereboglobus sp. PH5-10]
MNALPQRKPLGHEIPSWVRDGEIYFITICAENRAARPLIQGTIAHNLLESVAYLNDHDQWFARLFLVMPDHVHGLISFRADNSMPRRITAWKSFTTKQFGVKWQDRFFDHRLRRDESLDEKAHYIRMNPVRAGLVDAPEKWPHVLDGYKRLG